MVLLVLVLEHQRLPQGQRRLGGPRRSRRCHAGPQCVLLLLVLVLVQRRRREEVRGNGKDIHTYTHNTHTGAPSTSC